LFRWSDWKTFIEGKDVFREELSIATTVDTGIGLTRTLL
jgi:hypothetical protein